MTTAARRGRRPGNPETRSAILEAARSAFAAQGFRGTTIRGVASAAGVDPALVHHYFGSKDDLFMASMQLPVDPRELLGPVLEQGADGAAERMLRVFLSAWDDPELRLPLTAFARSVLDPGAQRLVAEGFIPVVLVPVGRALGVDRPEHRMPIVASQVLGLILTRYLLELEPLASMPQDELVRIYAPTIQRYLTGDL